MKNKMIGILQPISLAMALLLWQVGAELNKVNEWINPSFLPTPVEILIRIIDFFKKGELIPNVLVSVERVLLGFSIGIVIALILGYFMAKNRIVENILQPLFNAIGAVPAYAFMPLFVIWFGIGETAKIILIVYSTLLPLLTYTIQGIKSIDPLLIRSAYSLGANQRIVFIKIIIPSTLPHVLAGMKVSLGLCFAALVVAEMMGANNGLGYLIVNAKNWFRVSDMFMAIVLIGLLYSIMMAILNLIERKLCKWKVRDFTNAIE